MKHCLIPSFARHPWLCWRNIPRQFGKLTEVLQKSSNGRFGEWKAREIKELAHGSFGVADYEGVYSTLIQLFLEQIHTLLETCSSLERQINELLLQFDTTLTTIPAPGGHDPQRDR